MSVTKANFAAFLVFPGSWCRKRASTTTGTAAPRTAGNRLSCQSRGQIDRVRRCAGGRDCRLAIPSRWSACDNADSQADCMGLSRRCRRPLCMPWKRRLSTAPPHSLYSLARKEKDVRSDGAPGTSCPKGHVPVPHIPCFRRSARPSSIISHSAMVGRLRLRPTGLSPIPAGNRLLSPVLSCSPLQVQCSCSTSLVARCCPYRQHVPALPRPSRVPLVPCPFAMSRSTALSLLADFPGECRSPAPAGKQRQNATSIYFISNPSQQRKPFCPAQTGTSRVCLSLTLPFRKDRLIRTHLALRMPGRHVEGPSYRQLQV
jgi:hypothetical protein